MANPRNTGLRRERVTVIIQQADIKRFWSKVEVKTEDECWPWLAGLSGGYGSFHLNHEYPPTRLAHQVSYFIHFGVDVRNSGKHVHHSCENKKCVNPKHLELLNPRTHMLEGTSPPAIQARQTHCKRGHEFTPENTYTYRGMRHCRTCHRDYVRNGGVLS